MNERVTRAALIALSARKFQDSGDTTKLHNVMAKERAASQAGTCIAYTWLQRCLILRHCITLHADEGVPPRAKFRRARNLAVSTMGMFFKSCSRLTLREKSFAAAQRERADDAFICESLMYTAV